MRFLRHKWVYFFCCARGPLSRPRNWSAVSTTNFTERNNDRIPFTLTFYLHNHGVKSMIILLKKTLNYFKIIPICAWRIFLQPRLITIKRNKNRIGNLLVRSAFQTSDQPGTFKLRSIKSMSFIRNVEKILGPYRSIKITDHITCTSANHGHLLHNLHSSQNVLHRRTWRRLGDRCWEHLS